MERSDPGWKHYLRFAAWIFPGAFLLFFSKILLLPKLETLWDAVGRDKYDGALIEFLILSTHFFFQQFPFLFAGFALLVGLVEYSCRKRPALRVAFYEISAWIFNLGVLIHLATVAVCALILGPLLSVESP